MEHNSGGWFKYVQMIFLFPTNGFLGEPCYFSSWWLNQPTWKMFSSHWIGLKKTKIYIWVASTQVGWNNSIYRVEITPVTHLCSAIYGGPPWPMGHRCLLAFGEFLAQVSVILSQIIPREAQWICNAGGKGRRSQRRRANPGIQGVNDHISHPGKAGKSSTRKWRF